MSDVPALDARGVGWGSLSRGPEMRLIKTLPRYKCDFCSHTATKAGMERHERICWFNPNRHCRSCNDTGWYPAENERLAPERCYFCGQRDPILTRAVLGPEGGA